MTPLSFFTTAYRNAYNRPWVPKILMSVVRFSIRKTANWMLPRYLARTAHRYELPMSKRTDKKIIVSFTSFPARINNVWQVIECMKRQTYQPAKILLWLSKEQFPTEQSIPESLRSRTDHQFEIRMVEGDIRSHKKYYYVAKEYPDSLVFLIDDDIYYPTDILERTMETYCEHPDAVVCNYGYHVGYSEDGGLHPYKSWTHEYHSSTDKDLFFGSGGGTLFRPSELHADLTNIALARELCPTADDIWLNAMTRLAHREVMLVENGVILPIKNERNIRLATLNMGGGANDVQIRDVESHYGKIWSRI